MNFDLNITFIFDVAGMLAALVPLFIYWLDRCKK